MTRDAANAIVWENANRKAADLERQQRIVARWPRSRRIVARQEAAMREKLTTPSSIVKFDRLMTDLKFATACLRPIQLSDFRMKRALDLRFVDMVNRSQFFILLWILKRISRIPKAAGLKDAL